MAAKCSARKYQYNNYNNTWYFESPPRLRGLFYGMARRSYLYSINADFKKYTHRDMFIVAMADECAGACRRAAQDTHPAQRL